MTRRKTPKILFVTYGGGHVSMVIPIVQHLVHERLADPIVIALTIAGAACRRAGIASLGCKDLLPEDDAEVLRIGRELTAGAQGHPDVDRAESIAYHGVSYVDLVHRFGPDRAAEMFESAGRAAFRPVSFFERVIKEIQPDLVVATNSPRSERAAIEAASALGVPSCCILDVFGVQEEWVMEPGFADRVCVLTESVRQTALDKGRLPHEVVVTGNPAFDALVSVRERRRGERDSQTFRVVWASHPEPVVHPTDPTRRGNLELPGRIADELVRCAHAHPDWRIVVRPHPTERDLAIGGPPNLSVVGDDQLEDRLIWADVVVTVASTVGVQAALAGVPVIAVTGSVISDDVPLAEYRLADGVDVDGLEAMLERLRIDPAVPDAGFPAVGGSTQRVTDVLLDLVR